ncbi:hypothetical protein NFI96_004743 [Prochilodus magdalenae]|nr:hypothetical protein NFI96_004743 [Prochilodus magdalenae]
MDYSLDLYTYRVSCMVSGADKVEISISDVEAVREGHQSEVLLSIADEFPPDRCFTLVFRGRRGNLDLVAESAEEAQSWVNGMRKLIENLENMDEQEKLDHLFRVRRWAELLHIVQRGLGICPEWNVQTAGLKVFRDPVKDVELEFLFSSLCWEFSVPP